MKPASDIKIGCCGFIVSQAEYFKLFRLIEIQNTLYQLPRLGTAEKWHDAAPPGFEFTMKAWQLITHEPSSPTYRRANIKIEPRLFNQYGRFRPSSEVLDVWDRTAMFARTLGATIVLLQCSATFRPTKDNIKNMREFFGGIDRAGLRFAWEPRGIWPEELVLRLCEELQLIHCVDPFKNKPLFGDVQYFRLHGVTGYAYRYSDDDLQRLKELVGEKPTYVLFNNNWMKDDVLRFTELIRTWARPLFALITPGKLNPM